MSDLRPGDQVLVKSVGGVGTFEETVQEGGETMAKIRLPMQTRSGPVRYVVVGEGGGVGELWTVPLDDIEPYP
jgi:hypothetical protein